MADVKFDDRAPTFYVGRRSSRRHTSIGAGETAAGGILGLQLRIEIRGRAFGGSLPAHSLMHFRGDDSKSMAIVVEMDVWMVG